MTTSGNAIETAGALPFDITNPESEGRLRAKIRQWIDYDNAIHRKYWNEWDNADDTLNGEIVPTGFTTDHSDRLGRMNDRRRRPERELEYVTVNRARPNHEAVMGDFASIRRKLVCSSRNPRHRNIAKVIGERIKYVEDDEMLPELVYFPAMDNAWSKGESVIKVTYNPLAKDLAGKFDVDYISIRDVLIAGDDTSPYHDKAQRKIHRIQLTREQALVAFGHLEGYDDSQWSADKEYDEPYRNGDDNTNFFDDKATYYEVQFSYPAACYYIAMPPDGDIEKIGYDEFVAYKEQPEFAEFVFYGGVVNKEFVAIYNSRMGVFSFQENAIDQCTLINLVNIQTESRLYAIGDTKNYAELQELLNVLVTVFLQNAKRSNVPILAIDPEVLAEHQQVIEDAIDHGGAAPGVTGAYYAQSINPALSMLIPWVIGWIQDVTNKHSASMGEMPAAQVAKETVQTLISKDRQAHGRKDVMLRYTLTRIAQCLAKFIQQMDDQPDYFESVDARPSGLKYIPINQRWTEQEYLFKIAEMYEIPPPPPELAQDPAVIEQYMAKIDELRMKFEEENDVQRTTKPGFVVNGEQYTPEKMRKLLSEMMLSTIEELQAVADVQAGPITVLVVNDLTQDANLKIVYSVDDDYENDKQFQANRALMLNERGSMSRLDMLKGMGIQNAEQLIENADAEQEAIAIGKAIASNPQMLAYVKALLSDPALVENIGRSMSGAPAAGKEGDASKGKPKESKQLTAA